MAAFFLEATVESIMNNKTTPMRAGTMWLNAQNCSNVEAYDTDSVKLWFQDRPYGGVKYNSPTPLMVSGTLATVATALEAAASCDNEYRTFYVTKQDGTHANMTLAVKDIAYMFEYPALDGVISIRYNSGGTKPIWLLVEMSSDVVADVFDSTYTGSGTGGTVFDEDEESF